MKKIALALFVLFSGTLFAQFDAQVSQYMMHNNSFNPAAAGESELIEIVLQHRINMINIQGGGKTTLFSINSPLKIGDKKHGIGVSLLKDEFGWFSNQTLQLQYAYKTKFGDGRLNVGTNVGWANIGFAGDSLINSKISIGEYHSITGDNAIPQTAVSGSGINIDLGVWYATNSWYAGASILHLNQPTIKWGQMNEFKSPGLMLLTGGLTHKLTDQKLVLKPSILIKSDFNIWQFDLSSRLEYDNKFWGGMTIRPFNSLVFMAGTTINGGLAASLAFDIPTSRLFGPTYGSVELLVSYSFEYVFSKQNSKYKSIRYL